MATQTLTAASGTWTCPPCVWSVLAESIGGGGAGAQASGAIGGGGGGGGGYCSRTFPTVPGTGYSYVCGAAGSDGATPAHGGLTWFKSNDGNGCVAPGGNSAAANSPTGNTGGSGGFGDVQHDGGRGVDGSAGSYGGGGGSSGGAAANGNTGSTSTGGVAVSPGGVGGNGRSGTSGVGSAPASGNGGGGGGALRTSGGTRAGGVGAAGVIFLTYYPSGSELVTEIINDPSVDRLTKVKTVGY